MAKNKKQTAKPGNAAVTEEIPMPSAAEVLKNPPQVRAEKSTEPEVTAAEMQMQNTAPKETPKKGLRKLLKFKGVK